MKSHDDVQNTRRMGEKKKDAMIEIESSQIEWKFLRQIKY